MRSLRTGAVLLGCLIAGGAFVVAGALKSLDVEGFARDIQAHGVTGPALSAILARVLIPFEIVVGAAAIIGRFRRGALAVLIVTLVGFIGVTGWAWAHGNTEGCGCFGRYMARGPLAVIVEDILLIAAAALALWLAPAPDRAARPARWKTRFLTLLAVGSTAFALASPRLPIDNIATALRPGVRLGDLGLDAVAGNLAEGDRLLVILELGEEASQQAIPALNELAATSGVPPVAGLTLSDDEKRAEFFFAHGPAFELLEVPASDLRRLYRRAPRAFTVHNGEVARVWQGIPPAKEFAR